MKKDLIQNEKKIVQFSIGRSGSTLAWQILRQIFANVSKAHEKEMREDFNNKVAFSLVVTQREPCDNLLSIIKVRRYSNNPASMEESLDKHVVSNYLGIYKRKEEILRRYCEDAQLSPLVLKYEEFIDNYDYIFDRLEKYYSIEIDRKRRQEMSEVVSIKNNKKIQEQYSCFSQVCNDSGIHGNHINFPYPGDYEKTLKKIDFDWLREQLDYEINYWKDYWKKARKIV
jgi:hypothetical protein